MPRRRTLTGRKERDSNRSLMNDKRTSEKSSRREHIAESGAVHMKAEIIGPWQITDENQADMREIVPVKEEATEWQEFIDIKQEAEDIDKEARRVKEETFKNWQDIYLKEEFGSAEQDIASLYQGHEVRGELVLGPTVLQAAPVEREEREPLLPPRAVSPAAGATRERQTRAGDNTGALECGACGVSRGHEHSLTRHFEECRRRRARKPISCKICSMEFDYYCMLNEHLRTHAEEKPYTCKICSRPSKRPSDLKRHMIDKQSGDQTCEKRFKCAKALKKHEKTQSDAKPYSCGTCKKEFASLVYLKRHFVVHTDEKPYSCEICKRKFKDSSNMNKHLRVHKGDKPYACQTCKKQFGTSTDLKRHDLTHTGVKPYCCTICRKAYRDSSALKRHAQKHATLK